MLPGPNACVSVTVSWNQAALAPGKNPSWVSICSSFVVSGVGSSSRACPELLERPGQQADLAHETVPTASSPTLRDDALRLLAALLTISPVKIWTDE